MTDKKKNTIRIVAIVLIVALLVLFILLLDTILKEENGTGIFNARDARTDALKRKIGSSYYIPKENVKTYLLMGIDKKGERIKTESITNTNQTDTILLLVVDSEKQEYSILAINRETMTKVMRLGINGTQAGYQTMQIALAHTYGTGMGDSALNAVDAVSKYLFNTTINRYATFTLDVMIRLVDYVDGIEITLDKDYSDIDSTYVNGAKIFLDKNNAEDFIRDRTGLTDSTNQDRMHRQELFVDAFLTKLQTKSYTDSELIQLFEELNPYFITDLSSNDLTILSKVFLSSDYEYKGIYTPDGINREGVGLGGEAVNEFYVNESSLISILEEILYDKLPD